MVLEQYDSTTGMTPWCNAHDLPLNRVRTGDDRIVCWFAWWIEAMDRSVPADQEMVSKIRGCDPSYRVVLAQGSGAVADTIREVAR